MSQYSADVGTRDDSFQRVEQLVGFEGPPEQFLIHMLEAHCRGTGAAAAGVFQLDASGRIGIVATYPQLPAQQPPPIWLNTAIQACNNGHPPQSAIVCPLHGQHDLYGQQAGEHVLVLPLRRRQQMHGAAAYHLVTRDQQAIERAREQLIWAVGLLGLYELRLTLQQQAEARRALESAQQVLTNVNEHARFQAAAMAFCNELASRCSAHRASLGFLRGRYVKTVAMSHTEKFTRKMRLVQDLEAVMEESLDQDAEVIHPAPNEATSVSRAAGELSRQHGPSAVVSLPIRYAGEPCAIVTLEREAERPWTWTEVSVLRLVCELCAARLIELHDRDRWVGARAAKSTRQALATALGPRHTWMKLVALLVLAGALFLTFAKGTYRVEAPFVVEAIHQRSIPAPFEGQLAEVYVEPGDAVLASQTVLAEFRTDDLELELNAARAERRRYLREADLAMRQDKQAERQMAEAQAEQAQARIDLLEHRLTHARIVAPISGVIVKGDYYQREGAPVEKGDVLFEIAPIESLRATLMVPEDQVMDLLNRDQPEADATRIKSLQGQLAATADPGRRFAITVESVNPMAEVIDNRNVFRVRARFDAAVTDLQYLRPGMEGLAKIDVDQRRYAWIWTRKLVNWVRVKLWL